MDQSLFLLDFSQCLRNLKYDSLIAPHPAIPQPSSLFLIYLFISSYLTPSSSSSPYQSPLLFISLNLLPSLPPLYHFLFHTISALQWRYHISDVYLPLLFASVCHPRWLPNMISFYPPLVSLLYLTSVHLFPP